MSRESDASILLLGATGQVGHELRRTLAPLGTVQTPDRSIVDLSEPERVGDMVEEQAPDVVVNAAAYTAVDEAEDDRETARVVNAEAPRIVAEACQQVGSWFVQYSTDYVFDGTRTTPYREEDAPNPLNVYGRTKLEADRAIQQVGGRHLIFRTGWVYSDRRSNFLRTMLDLAEENDHLTVVDDQTGTPTWAGWIAEATATALEQAVGAEAPDRHSGLYHLSASGQTSWYGFARAIFARFGYDINVEPVTSADYPTAAERPAYSVLSTERVRSVFDLTVSTWTEQLAAVQRRMEDVEPAESGSA